MCGITGFWNGPRGFQGCHLGAMVEELAHRGPDDRGHWTDPAAGIALGHRRLSIIDLSAAGHQPMASPSGRFVAIYNGEIYNHRDLRADLEQGDAAPSWRGHSDTETLLAGFDRWGIVPTLKRLNGMFAMAVWDRRAQRLTLARDRLGEKPLYYGRSNNTFLFGSELKALTAHPDFTRELDHSVLVEFLRLGYVPAPCAIWNGIAKLLPGCYLEVSEAGEEIGPATPYWDFAAIAASSAANPLPEGADLVDQLEMLLSDAVGRRMEADVPLGAFLSGGIDSSTVVALMQAQASNPVRTFTIGFHETAYSEAEHARAVAQHLGTEHTELLVTADDALALVPRLPDIWDEPFADSSQIPTYLVSALTREHVTVSLSGDGGDELFGGYYRYLLGMQLHRLSRRLPGAMRKGAARLVGLPTVAATVAAASHMLPRRVRPLAVRERLHKVGRVLQADTGEAMYRSLVAGIEYPEDLVLQAGNHPNCSMPSTPPFPDFRQQMMYLDTLTYLPDDILQKLDRASMAASLETRAPFLDHRVVEFAWKLPMSAKIRGSAGKHILKQVLYRHVPPSLFERQKAGFGLPLAQWLDGPLRRWADSLLDSDRLRSEGVLDPQGVARLRRRVRGGANVQGLWAILMFQAWWEKNGPSRHAAPPVEHDLVC